MELHFAGCVKDLLRISSQQLRLSSEQPLGIAENLQIIRRHAFGGNTCAAYPDRYCMPHQVRRLSSHPA